MEALHSRLHEAVALSRRVIPSFLMRHSVRFLQQFFSCKRQWIFETQVIRRFGSSLLTLVCSYFFIWVMPDADFGTKV